MKQKPLKLSESKEAKLGKSIDTLLRPLVKNKFLSKLIGSKAAKNTRAQLKFLSKTPVGKLILKAQKKKKGSQKSIANKSTEVKKIKVEQTVHHLSANDVRKNEFKSSKKMIPAHLLPKMIKPTVKLTALAVKMNKNTSVKGLNKQKIKGQSVKF